MMCYLIYAKKMTCKQALDYIRMRRPCIDPVDAIQRQVQQFADYMDTV